MKTLLLAGFFVLVPLLALALLLEKAFQLSLRLTRPVRRFMPVDTLGEMAAANIIAILALLLACLLAGLVARLTTLSGMLDRLDRIVVSAIPTYAVAKVALGTAANDMQGERHLVPVMVRFDDYSQIAFEVERSGDRVILFLPGSPSVFSGASVVVDAERVSPIDLPFGKVVGMLQMLGRGTLGTQRSTSPADGNALGR